MNRIFSCLWIAGVAVLSNCSTRAPRQERQLELTFENAQIVRSRLKDRTEVRSAFGPPAETRDNGRGLETWTYHDREGLNRMQIQFRENGRVGGVIWIPLDPEPEVSLNAFLRRHPGLALRPVDMIYTSRPHTENTETTYSDDQTITILHDDANQRVEAYLWFDPRDTRSPSADDPSKHNRLVEY